MAVILIVEDDDDIGDAVSSVLELEGILTTRARNGQVALDLLTSGLRPRVILLDLMMPVLNGWGVLKALEESPSLSGIPVIIMSAAEEARTITRYPVLSKPFDLDHLLRLLRPE